MFPNISLPALKTVHHCKPKWKPVSMALLLSGHSLKDIVDMAKSNFLVIPGWPNAAKQVNLALLYVLYAKYSILNNTHSCVQVMNVREEVKQEFKMHANITKAAKEFLANKKTSVIFKANFHVVISLRKVMLPLEFMSDGQIMQTI